MFCLLKRTSDVLSCFTVLERKQGRLPPISWERFDAASPLKSLNFSFLQNMPGYRPLARRPEIINRNHVQIVHLCKSNLGNEGRKSLWFSILTHRNGCVCFSRLRWIFRILESIKGFCLFFSVYAGQCHSLEIS